MFTGEQIVAELRQMGITHVVWLPDSTLGQWEAALSSTPGLKLIRVCREGEAWAIAAGLHLGGAKPLVMIQCTGLFESGDSLRNAIYDYGLPLYAVIGHRNALNPSANDSARDYTIPTLDAWKLDFRVLDTPDKLPLLAPHYAACQKTGQPGVAVVAEGKM